jgi:opacity protein-like surface antigen
MLLILACMTSFEANAHLYSGINLGINAVTIKKHLIYPLDADEPTSSRFNNAYTNFHAQFLVGYELPLAAQFSTSIEANADVFTGKARYKINQWFFDENVYAQEQFKYGFTFFLLPTYQYNESTRFFVGPGVSTSRFQIRADNTAGNVGVSANYNKWLTGGGLKAGSITTLTNVLDLVLTYQFMQYGSVTKTHLEPLTEEALQGNYKPYVNTVLVGLRAHFPEPMTK